MIRPETLWLIRHGPINAKPSRCIGWTDLPLFDPEQAQKEANKYLPLIKTSDAVYTSDLVRAVQTATPIAQLLKCPLVATNALREMHFGQWEGKSWKEIEAEFPEAYHHYMQNWKTANTPQGESYSDLTGRVRSFLENIFKKAEYRSIVIVGHAGSLRVIISEILGRSAEESMEIQIDRGKAVVLQFDCHSGDWKIDQNPGE